MTLYTGFVGAHTLETVGPLTPEQVAVAVARLASTVADIHRLGLVHGRIDPSHVLLGAGARPILCGFSGAGGEGETPLDGPGAIAEFRDPAAGPDMPLNPTVDVYSLGTLLRVLVIGDETDMEPIPERRFTFRRGRVWNGYLRRALLMLADQCTDEEPLRRPSASRLAADIQAMLADSSDANTQGRGSASVANSGDFADHSTTRIGRRLTLAASVVGLVLVFWGVATVRSGKPTAAMPPASAPTTSSSGSPPPPEASPSSSPKPTSAVTLLGDRVVSVDGHQFAVGDAGDRVVLGDWNCDGTPTAALARPSTGDVFVFDSWPAAGVEATAEPVTTVSGAVDLRAEARGNCSALFAIRADGTESEVR